MIATGDIPKIAGVVQALINSKFDCKQSADALQQILSQVRNAVSLFELGENTKQKLLNPFNKELNLLISDISSGRPNFNVNSLQSSLNQSRNQRKKLDDEFKSSTDFINKARNWIVGLKFNPNSVKDLPTAIRNSADRIGALNVEIEKHQNNLRNLSLRMFDSDVSIKFLEDKIADLQNANNMDAKTLN